MLKDSLKYQATVINAKLCLSSIKRWRTRTSHLCSDPYAKRTVSRTGRSVREVATLCIAKRVCEVSQASRIGCPVQYSKHIAGVVLEKIWYEVSC